VRDPAQGSAPSSRSDATAEEDLRLDDLVAAHGEEFDVAVTLAGLQLVLGTT